MSRIVVTVALLLISGLGNSAAAQDGLKDTSKKAQKLHNYLEAMGVNNPKILEFTSTIGSRMEGRYIRLTEEKFDSGRLVLHYAARPKISTRQLELKFQPANAPHSEFIATTRSMMYQYKLSF